MKRKQSVSKPRKSRASTSRLSDLHRALLARADAPLAKFVHWMNENDFSLHPNVKLIRYDDERGISLIAVADLEVTHSLLCFLS